MTLEDGSSMPDEKNLINLLFLILFGYIFLNFIITVVLQNITSSKSYKDLAIYWISLFITFIFHGFFQHSPLEIALSFGIAVIPMSILANLVLQTYHLELPWKKQSLLYIALYGMSLLISRVTTNFTLISLPITVCLTIPLLYTSYICLIKFRQTSTLLQKFLGTIFLLMPIHCIDFAFFRLEEGAQLWGWLVSFSIYQCLSVILPTFILEEITRNENKRISNIMKSSYEEIEQLKRRVIDLEKSKSI
ncbi:MAG: hypothetical protein K2P81_13130 [Bacteriovoracaceae bacterium]|nr:hypothetical protein [Bacteriovoracaceae bacterium]